MVKDVPARADYFDRKPIMKSAKRKMIWISWAVVFPLLITACGSGEKAPTEEVSAPMEEAAAEEQEEMNATGVEFQEEELPENFPEAFPLPEYAKVGSSVPMPGDDSFRIFFAFPEVTLEEALAYYHQELPASGWTIENESAGAMGMILEITSPESEAKLEFITDEFGVVLDLTLVPLGEMENIPGSDETFGESEGLGEAGGDFPADFPLPSRFTAIDLPAKLAAEGYQMAFTFPDMAELAIIELSTALMGGSWEIGEFEIEAMTGSYMVPFSGPGGFQGYALITANGEVAGLPSVTGAVIALHAGELK